MLGTVGTASCTLDMKSVYLAATASASVSGLGTGGANVCLVTLVWPPRPVVV